MGKANLEFTTKTRQIIIERDGERCRAWWIAPDVPCSNILEIDHIIPRSREGCTNEASNGWILCKHCHELKHGFPEAAQYLGMYGLETYHKKFDQVYPETFGLSLYRLREEKKKKAGIK